MPSSCFGSISCVHTSPVRDRMNACACARTRTLEHFACLIMHRVFWVWCAHTSVPSRRTWRVYLPASRAMYRMSLRHHLLPRRKSMIRLSVFAVAAYLPASYLFLFLVLLL